MKRAIVIVSILVVIGGLVGGIWLFINENPEWWLWLQDEFAKTVEELGLEPEEEVAGLAASGFIEADQAAVITELGGRIVGLGADEGDEVERGAVLVELDDSLLKAQIEMAKAEVTVAEAALVQVQAGVRQETLVHADAMLQQTIAAREAARVAWEDALAMLENPQEMEMAITAARAQLGVLDLQEKQARALADSAEVGRDSADEAFRYLAEFEPYDEWVLLGKFRVGTLPPEIPIPPDLVDGEYSYGGYRIVIKGGTITVYARVTIKIPIDVVDEARYEQAIATYQSWIAWTGLAQAQTARNGVESYLVELDRQRANPVVLEAQTNAAKSQYEIAASAVAQAQAHVEGLKVGVTQAQIGAVEAQVEVARAALAALETQVSMYALEAPISGIVLERPIHLGEVALPGAPLITLADLDNLTLTVYVPEDRLGQVRLGNSVSVSVDSYPGEIFTGTVTFVSSQAEFTPKNVQTREERVNMVFAVRVSLPNSGHMLKPGMPADAVIGNGE